MKKRRSKSFVQTIPNWVGFLSLVTFSVVMLPRCQATKEYNSNLAVSEHEANANLQSRLSDTQEVRVRLDAVRSVVRSINSVLRDVGKAVDLKVNGKPGDRINTYYEVFHDTLREANKGVIKYKPDGSWYLERTANLSLGRKANNCQTSTVRVVGRRVSSFDEMSLSLIDCSASKPIPIAEIRSSSSKNIDVSFHPNIIEHMDLGIELQPISECNIRIAHKDAELNCKPIHINNNDFSITLDPLHYKRDKSGTFAAVKLTVLESDGTQIADAEFHSSPFEKRAIRVCLKRGGCSDVHLSHPEFSSVAPAAHPSWEE